MTYKIMWDGGYGVEEVDETESADDAAYLCKEYQLAYKGRVWIKRGR